MIRNATFAAPATAAFLLFIWAMAPNRAVAAECVIASWYGTESGNRTANGEHFDGSSMTAAHKTLPFGTKLQVSYRGKSVTVRINDRGPAKWTRRDIDLSRAAARSLGMIAVGVATVCISVIQ